MPSGSKPGERRGGRQVGSRNKALQERDRRYAEAEAAAIAALTPEQIDNITPEQVLMLAMKTAIRGGNLTLARNVAVDIAPYKHSKKAPKDDDGDGKSGLTVIIKGGLPD